jgi:alpha-ribazole phosphatase/probable phosphoglycerate mutase
MVSSDRRRALDTAGIVAEPHGLVVEPSAALREIDFGAWEGRSLSDLWAEEPQAAEAWTDDIRRTPPSFGESLDDLQRRVAHFWASLLPLPVSGDMAVVAHGGSLAALRAVITGEAIADTFAARLPIAGAIALTAG